jgi:hypothetical protein
MLYECGGNMYNVEIPHVHLTYGLTAIQSENFPGCKQLHEALDWLRCSHQMVCLRFMMHMKQLECYSSTERATLSVSYGKDQSLVTQV